MLEPIFVGTKHFEGSVDATDPCYSKDVWCRVNDIAIIDGDYHCIAWYDDEEKRVMICGIYLVEEDGKSHIADQDLYECIGEAGVDSALCGFFSNKPDYGNSEWNNFCDSLDGKDYSIIDCGFFTSSGYGDGGYGVYGYRYEDDSDLYKNYAYKDSLKEYSQLEIRF